MARAIMIQGTGSNVGKSLLVAGLCRHFARQGLRVRPFKPQNMSNNAAVAEGGEIGRAQALQALACGVAPCVDMNPVLLKPETDTGAQVVVQGERLTTAKARDYARLKPTLLEKVLESYRRLSAEADLVIIEGAGSPAEVNLRAGDIANMGFAEAVGAPVILAGDIDRGGVIAQMVGTQAVLAPPDARRIKGFLINKFRGDPSLFDDGRRFIEDRAGWPCLGVIPWFPRAHALPAEDAADIRPSSGGGSIKIAVPQLSRIANFDDLDPLRLTPGVQLTMVQPGQALPGDADVVLIPGSKSTRGDLGFFRAQGWEVDLRAHWRRGGRVLGICGGYQMLGRVIRDPLGVEGPPGETTGLNLLQVETAMVPHKRVARVEGRHRATGLPVSGYEIHIGRTQGPDCARAWLEIQGRAEGAASADGRVAGCYVHGLFTDDAFRAAYLAELGEAGALEYGATVAATLDSLADHLADHVDLDALWRIALPQGRVAAGA